MTDAAALTSGTARAVRSVAVACATVVIAVGCHVTAGAAMPSPWIVLAMLAAAVPLCWALSAHRWSVSELVGVFLLAQTTVHLSSMAVPASEMPMGGPLLGLTPAMTASHLVGAALLVAFVRRGEGTLWSLVEILAPRVAALMRPLGVTPVTSRPRIIVGLLRPASRPWLTVAVDRGPPMGSASLGRA